MRFAETASAWSRSPACEILHTGNFFGLQLLLRVGLTRAFKPRPCTSPVLRSSPVAPRLDRSTGPVKSILDKETGVWPILYWHQCTTPQEQRSYVRHGQREAPAEGSAVPCWIGLRPRRCGEAYGPARCYGQQVARTLGSLRALCFS
jgi:hypothetical protein